MSVMFRDDPSSFKLDINYAHGIFTWVYDLSTATTEFLSLLCNCTICINDGIITLFI